MSSLIEKTIYFLKSGVWQVPLAQLPRWKAWWYRAMRVSLLTYQGFSKNQIQQGASSLTYYTLLAIVPIVALFIGIARGFRLEQTLENFLLERFADQQFAIKQIFKFASASLEEARGGLITGIGIAILVWATIQILTNIELVFNQIWEVKKGRSFVRRFTDYLSMSILAPVILLLTTGVSGFISTFLSGHDQSQGLIGRFASLLLPVLSFFSFLLISALFTLLYVFMPNTKVRATPAIIAGILVGIAYQLLQWLYLYFQIGVSRYNAIFGTFAALPLFLVWLHLSWLIALIGAKFCYAIQNVDAYEFLEEDVDISQKIRTICSLWIAHFCIKKFSTEAPAPTAAEIAHALTIPLHLAGQLIEQLVEAKILIETKRNDQEVAFQPAKSIESLTIKRVLDMIDEKGTSIPLPPSKDLNSILKSLEEFSNVISKSDANVLLKNL